MDVFAVHLLAIGGPAKMTGARVGDHDKSQKARQFDFKISPVTMGQSNSPFAT
jgi:hypothetical protein